MDTDEVKSSDIERVSSGFLWGKDTVMDLYKVTEEKITWRGLCLRGQTVLTFIQH